MKTKFDHISDAEICEAVLSIDKDQEYECLEDDTDKIAYLVFWMSYMKSWIGWPVTYFSPRGELFYDGHHRVRASRYIADNLGIQILIPVRM